MPWRCVAGLRPAAGRVLPAGQVPGQAPSLEEVGNIQVVVFLEDDRTTARGGDVEGLRGSLGVRRPVGVSIRGHGDPLRPLGTLRTLGTLVPGRFWPGRLAGHGVPAAFFMAVARTKLRDLALRHQDPGSCLAETNEVLCSQNPLDLFVTVFYCILEPTTGVLRYANGGHNPPYVRHADGTVEALRGAGGPVLGALSGTVYPTHTVQLGPGDRLVLYTDGVTEAFNPAAEAYGEERLIAEVRAHADGGSMTLIEHICRSVTDFAGTAPQSDDITLTVVSWKAP